MSLSKNVPGKILDLAHCTRREMLTSVLEPAFGSEGLPTLPGGFQELLAKYLFQYDG